MICSPFATRLTIFGVADTNNYKPFRSEGQKNVALAMAKRDDDGVYRSTAQRSSHPSADFKPTKEQKRHAAAFYEACGEDGKAAVMLAQ